MKALTILTIMVLCGGCSDSAHEYTRLKNDWDCNKSTTEERANFTLQCISNANPKSDEEPEDWILMCEDIANRLYCKERTYNITYFSENANEHTMYDTEISRSILSD